MSLPPHFFLSSFTNNICSVDILWILVLRFCQIIFSSSLSLCTTGMWQIYRSDSFALPDVCDNPEPEVLLCKGWHEQLSFVISSWSWRTAGLEGEERRFERKNNSIPFRLKKQWFLIVLIRVFLFQISPVSFWLWVSVYHRLLVLYRQSSVLDFRIIIPLGLMTTRVWVIGRCRCGCSQKFNLLGLYLEWLTEVCQLRYHGENAEVQSVWRDWCSVGALISQRSLIILGRIRGSIGSIKIALFESAVFLFLCYGFMITCKKQNVVKGYFWFCRL